MIINIETEVERATNEVRRHNQNLLAYIAAIPTLAPVLNAGTFDYCYVYPESNQVICRVRTRAEFAPIRALRHGKWEKQINEEDGVPLMRYDGIADCGTRFTCYVCELPPSCRIEETKVEVEAHTKIERKVVCTEARELAEVQ